MYFETFVLFLALSRTNLVYGADYDPEVIFKWTYLNFTFESPEQYSRYTQNNEYIPKNNFMGSMKTYNDKFYLGLQKFRNGTPISLASFPADGPSENPLLTPFPDWSSNTADNCSSFQNVANMEINAEGILWVIDGLRMGGNTCPQKLVLLDLNDDGNVVQTYNFPENVSSGQNGAFGEIVISDNFAFITDSSPDSPGLIVYSREDNVAWKLYDEDSMWPENMGENFTITSLGQEVHLTARTPIFGVAVSQVNLPNDQRYVYYTALDGYNIYSVPYTDVINSRNDNETWRQHIQNVGRKSSIPSHDMTTDTKNNFFINEAGAHALTLLTDDDDEAQVVYSDPETFDWPETFGFDNQGNMYVSSNKYSNLFYAPDAEIPEPDSDDFRYFITRFKTGADCYVTHE